MSESSADLNCVFCITYYMLHQLHFDSYGCPIPVVARLSLCVATMIILMFLVCCWQDNHYPSGLEAEDK